MLYLSNLNISIIYWRSNLDIARLIGVKQEILSSIEVTVWSFKSLENFFIGLIFFGIHGYI